MLTGEALVEERCVFDRPRQVAVVAVGVGIVGRDLGNTAVAGFDADQPAECSGYSNRPSIVCRVGDACHAGCERGGAASRRTAGRDPQIPRIARDPPQV